VRVTVVAGDQQERVVGTTFGRRNRPHLLEAWGQRFDVQLDEHLAVFRYDDRPGMVGRIGTAFGEAGVNIVSAAVGRHDDVDGAPIDGSEAVMVVTTDGPVPDAVVDEVVAGDGFASGRTITL
jgi:D-3-phosphoglycerate dehydrogenase